MSIKLNCISGFLFSALLSCNGVFAGSIGNRIIFSNLTNQPVQETQEPYLDNFSYDGNNSAYKFDKPGAVIQPATLANAYISYDWWYNWFNVNQFAYNYPGRSPEYGCFVTEIGLSAYLVNYHIVISSYRKDPSYPNDYLICHAKQDSLNSFRVNFVSSQDEGEKNDSQSDDSKRYTIAGDSYELAHTSDFTINKPIPLNPILFLYPDHLSPSAVDNSYTPVPDSPEQTREIRIINYASVPVIKGPSPRLDKFSRFSKQYSFEMPATIFPYTTGSVKIGSPKSDFNLQLFNYHIEGYDANSGCYIKTSQDWNNRSTSTEVTTYFDSFHPEKNLYCLDLSTDTVAIFDIPLPADLEMYAHISTHKPS